MQHLKIRVVYSLLTKLYPFSTVRQIPKMVKEISASKKQPDGKVQCFEFYCKIYAQYFAL